MRKITCYKTKGLRFWQGEQLQRCTGENEESLARSCSPIAISQLDIYQKFSLNPQTEGYISRNYPVQYPIILSNVSSIDISCNIFPEVAPDPILELSPFENIEASMNMLENKDPIFADLHINEDPCESLKTSPHSNVERMHIPPTYRSFGNLFKTAKQSVNSAIKNFELKVEICRDDESLSKANFNPKAKMLLYNNLEPINNSSNIMRFRRDKPIKRKLGNANSTTKSILKNKFNEFEENERFRAYQHDSLNIQDFMYELDNKEKIRGEESILNPKLRQIQISRYNNGEFL